MRLTYGREPTQIGFNRRTLHDDRVVMAPNPQGAVVPWVDVLSAESLDGGRIAGLFSYAAHPVIVQTSSVKGHGIEFLRAELAMIADIR